MAVTTFMLLIVAIGAVVGMISWATSKRSSLSRSEKAELQSLRQFKRSVNKLALQHQEIEPSLSACVLDEVYRIDQKELS